MPDVKTVVTVDPGGNSPEWDGEIGFVPTIVEKVAPNPENTVAVVCGPPIMIKYTIPVLQKLGFKDDMIISTLENRMKMRTRQMRTLQRWQRLRMQRRTSLYIRANERHAGRVLRNSECRMLNCKKTLPLIPP